MPVRAECEPQEVRYVRDVLMAYATRHGSTRQVAEAVTAAMRKAGAQVTALPARDVRESAAGYDLVVLGAPLYSGRWHHDAHGSSSATGASSPPRAWRCSAWDRAPTPRRPGRGPVPSLTGR
jgi:flavorubredoxin